MQITPRSLRHPSIKTVQTEPCVLLVDAGSTSLGIGCVRIDAGGTSLGIGCVRIDPGGPFLGIGFVRVDAGGPSLGVGCVCIDAGGTSLVEHRLLDRNVPLFRRGCICKLDFY